MKTPHEILDYWKETHPEVLAHFDHLTDAAQAGYLYGAVTWFLVGAIVGILFRDWMGR